MINPIYNPSLNKMDIIQQYIDIAFADICDYIEFGTEEVMTKDGSLVRREFARLKVDMIEAHPGPIKLLLCMRNMRDNMRLLKHYVKYRNLI